MAPQLKRNPLGGHPVSQMSDALLGLAIIAAAGILYVALDSLSIYRFVIDDASVRIRFLGIPVGSVRFEEISGRVELG